MLKLTIFILAVACVAAVSVTCIEYDPSILARASDCSVSRLDSNIIQWGVKISFTDDAEHRSNNWFNLLADMEHPRFPYFPAGSKCESTYGKFTRGQSVLLNCTQGFDDIPTGYVNQVILLEDSEMPFGVAMKIPLSSGKGELSINDN